MPIRVLLADAHALVRQCLYRLVGMQPDLEVIGEAEDGRLAVDLVRELLPDIVIMDTGMPNLNGIEATHLILREFAQVKVVGLSANRDRMCIGRMLTAGASAYVLKDWGSEVLVEAVRAVSRGETYLCPKASCTVVNHYVILLSLSSGTLKLTRRECQIVQLLAEGKAVRDIAQVLHRSPKTVDANRRQIMNKLGISDLAELTKYAVRERLTSLEF